MDQQNLITNVRRQRQRRQVIIVSTSWSSFSSAFLFLLFTLIVIIGAVDEKNRVLEVVHVTEPVAGEQEILISSNDFNEENRLPATAENTDVPNADDNKNTNVTIHQESDDGDNYNDNDNEEESTKSDEIRSSTIEMSRDDDSNDEGDVIGNSAMGEEVKESVSTIKKNVTSKFSSNNNSKTKNEMKKNVVNKPVANDDNEEEEEHNPITTSTSSLKMTKTKEGRKKNEMETEEVSKKMEMKDVDVNKPLTDNNEEKKERSATTASTAPSKMAKTEDVQKKKEMEGMVNNPMARDIEEADRTTISPGPLKKNTKTEEVNKKMEMKDDIIKLVTNNIEEEKRNIITTSTLPSKMERIEIEQKKKEIKGSVNNPIITISSSASEKNTKVEAAEVNKKMESEDDVVMELKKIGENVVESISSFNTLNNTFLIYEDDNDGDSVIDLDFGTKGENLKERESTNVVVEVKEEIKQEQDSVDLIMNNNNNIIISTVVKGSEDSSSEINATTQDFSISGINATTNNTAGSKEEKEPPKGSLASFFENAKMRSGAGTDSVIRQAQLLGEKQEQHESPTTIVISGYRGEPWGQYRSTRRLPDLELLRLIFEDANNSGTNRSKGDAKSQKVLEEWQTNPLYEENMTMEAAKSAKDISVVGVGAAFPIEEQEQELYEYRTRKFGDNDDNVADYNPNAKGTNDRKNDISSIDSNQNKKNNADVKSEFVEGLDDIDDFFEGVDPPDELDVGFGSSIQDVLMDKGKHILLKKVRGVLRRIQTGYQMMGHNLKKRVSQFQPPFHRSKETINVASDLKADTTNSSLNTNPNKQYDKRPIRDAIISALTVGKRTLEQTSDWVDRLLDRFDGRSDDDSTNFEDFNGFDLDNLPTLIPPKPDL
mmetsp:Transcript_54043/g.62425  ORF Transcript_54043/g.62425 Transcript_54043/m.62425 type:complete len:883 (-) Transcript_54043:108-2756(-)